MSLLAWSLIFTQNKQTQCPISLNFHQIYPQIHFVILVADIFPRVYMSGTGHNMFNIGPFLGAVLNLNDSFSIFLSGCMFCCLNHPPPYIAIRKIGYLPYLDTGRLIVSYR